MYVLSIAPAAANPSETATVPDPDLLGQKAAGILRMSRLGLPVPPALVLHRGLWRDVCGPAGPGEPVAVHRQRFFDLWPSLWQELQPHMARLLPVPPSTTESADADAQAHKRPLVLAVRGGAAQSMPGMLASILNVGLHPAGLPALAAWAGSRRFALDCYARFLQQFCHAMLSADGSAADPRGDAWVDGSVLSAVSALTRREVRHDPPTTDDALIAQAKRLRAEVTARTGVVLPDDLPSQLGWSIWGVLRSADAPRSRDYRHLTGLPADLGTAVVLQAMVYGNLDDRSATGVLFTRDPSTGAKFAATPGLSIATSNAHAPSVDDPAQRAPYGEFLLCAQGEDVVGGTGLPQPLSELARVLPDAAAKLLVHADVLERQLGDMQDIEFTIERGALWLLQARTGKRSAQAMVRIAADLTQEGVVSPVEALSRIDAGRLVELLHPTIAPDAPRIRIARGLPASPGVAIGPIAFSSAEVEAHVRAGEGRTPVLVRVDTSPDDIVGIRLAAGVLTARGGLTSHAAVVARGLGRPAVVGASSLSIDQAAGTVSTREHSLQRGDVLSIDGRTGDVLLGEVALSVANLRENRSLQAVLDMAATRRRLRTFSTVEQPADLAMAVALGAEGLVFVRRLAAADAPCVALPGHVQSLVFNMSASDVLNGDGVAGIAAWRQSLRGDAGISALPWTVLWPAHAVAAADRQATAARLRAQLADHSRALGLPIPSLGVVLTAFLDRSALVDLARQADVLVLSPASLLRSQTGHPAVDAAAIAAGATWHRSLAEPLSQTLSALRAEAPGLPIGLCDLDAATAVVHPAAVAFCEQQGFAFYGCPPLRLPLAQIAAAQAAIQAS